MLREGIQLSILHAEIDDVSIFLEAVEEFIARVGVKIIVRTSLWERGWAELMKAAIYKIGPDISEVGTSWVGDLVAMEAIRPFSKDEITRIRGQRQFLDTPWETSVFPGDLRVWSIPWGADVRVVYYRRDLFEKARIDEEETFNSYEGFVDALEKLKASGVEIPLAIPTGVDYHPLHILASFVWGAGGEFMSPDGKRALFNEPEAIEGMCRYFNLHRYLSPQLRNLRDGQVNELFRYGKSAMTISGQWVLRAVESGDAIPEVRENLGVAPVPGVPFVGGANLIIWQHSPYQALAIEVIRFLTSQRIQDACFQAFNLLPTRVEALQKEPFETNPHWRVIKQSLLEGRAFKGSFMWGMVEDEFVNLLNSIWNVLFTDSEADVKKLVKERMDDFATKINAVLSEKFWRKH